MAERAAPVNNNSEVEAMMAGLAREERGLARCSTCVRKVFFATLRAADAAFEKLALVSCPIAVYTGTSSTERVCGPDHEAH